MGERDQASKHPSYFDRSHEQTRAALPGYATALALGQAPAILYSAVAEHLRGCSACRRELDELMELVIPTYHGQLEPMTDAPKFDLSFLGTALPRVQPARPGWFIDNLYRLVVEFSDSLLASMQQTMYAAPARGAAMYHYSPELPNNLGITIDVFAGDRQPQVGNVQVLLDIPSRDPFDQGGTQVRLQIGELEWNEHTSPTGSVTFASVPLDRIAQLRVEIALPVD